MTQTLENTVVAFRLTRDELLEHLLTTASTESYAIAFSLLRSQAEAEDAVQDALLTVCRAHRSLRDSKLAKAWFLRIVTTTCLKKLRRQKLKKRFFGNNTSEDRPYLKIEEDSPWKYQKHQELYIALDELPSKQKVALILRYGRDYSIREISQFMHSKDSTVKTHLVRALQNLRRTLAKIGQES